MTTATLKKENISLGLAHSSEVQFIFIMGEKEPLGLKHLRPKNLPQ